MAIPFNKIVEDFSFGGPRFIPINSDGCVVYLTENDILAAVGNDSTGTLEVRRSTDGGSTWNAIAQTFNTNGNGWMFTLGGTVYLLQYNNLSPASTPFQQWDGTQFVAVPSNAFPFAGTNNFVYNVRIISGVAYIILVEYTQPGPQKNSRIYTWNGTTVSLFHSKNDMEYRDIAQIGADILIVGFSHDATGDFSVSTVYDGMTFTDYPSSVFAGDRIVAHDGSHYVLDVPDQGSRPYPTRIARVNSTTPLSFSSGFLLEFAGSNIEGSDLFSDGSNLYVISPGLRTGGFFSIFRFNPRVYRYSTTSLQLDEQSFIFPSNSFISQQAPASTDTILLATWNVDNQPENFRLYEYDFATPTPGTNFQVMETKLIEVGQPCSENSVYLNWLNRLGGRSFWLFDQETDSFEDRFRTRAESEIRTEVGQIDQTQGNFKQIGLSEVKTLRIGADGLSDNRLTAIIEMFSSPNILMLVSEPGASPPLWVQVAIRPGSFTFSSRNRRVQFEIQLPDRYLQQN